MSASEGSGLGAAARAARRRLGAASWRLRSAWQERRLMAEQRRGVLGPAHLAWHDNTVGENRKRWNEWDWSARGEEWTASEEWKAALIDDVLKRWMPAGGVVLEIGPGAGRWSEVLVTHASHVILVDVSERPLDLCRERLGDPENVDYLLSPGSSFPGVADGSVDAVWSFDVFVHVAPRDQAAYLDEVARVLTPGGVAVIHHADGRNRGTLPSSAGWRAPMSRSIFATMATERGLHVESQFDSWGPGGRHELTALGDAITVCRRTG